MPWYRVVSSTGAISSRGSGTDGARQQKDELEGEYIEVLAVRGTQGDWRVDRRAWAGFRRSGALICLIARKRRRVGAVGGGTRRSVRQGVRISGCGIDAASSRSAARVHAVIPHPPRDLREGGEGSGPEWTVLDARRCRNLQGVLSNFGVSLRRFLTWNKSATQCPRTTTFRLGSSKLCLPRDSPRKTGLGLNNWQYFQPEPRRMGSYYKHSLAQEDW